MYGYTAAQIELMMYDAPVVKYKRSKDKPKPGQKGFTRTADQARAEYEKWKKRQDAEKQAGVKYDLNALMSSGKKEKAKSPLDNK